MRRASEPPPSSLRGVERKNSSHAIPSRVSRSLSDLDPDFGLAPIFMSFCRLCGVLRARKSAASRRRSVSASSSGEFNMASEPEKPRGFEFPADFASCIASITSFWASLEYSIDMSIWHLAGVYPAIGACMTGQIYTLNNRLLALQSLLKLRQAPQPIIDRVNRFSEKIRKTQEIRNRITHDPWYQSPTTKEMSQLEIGAKGTLTYNRKSVPIASLRSDAEKVRAAMSEASGIRGAIEDALPTLPKILLSSLHPTVHHYPGNEQTRATDGTFRLFPPQPSPW
jgi:hypothetical protein